MLQAFKNHCSVRFDTDWFGDHQDEVVDAGVDHGAGFIELPYSKEVPAELVTSLLRPASLTPGAEQELSAVRSRGTAT